MKKINTLKSFKSKCLNGIINVPGDKSISQRALMFASLCFGSVKIYGLLKSKDVMNTLNALKSLGVIISIHNNNTLLYNKIRYYDYLVPEYRQMRCNMYI